MADKEDRDGCLGKFKWQFFGVCLVIILILVGCIVPDGGGQAPPMEGANWTCIIPIAMAALLLAMLILAAGRKDQ
jgi:hypothetical protein